MIQLNNCSAHEVNLPTLPHSLNRMSETDKATVQQLLCDMAALIDAPIARTPDQWADKHRRLPPGSAEPGPWRSTRTPYMIPIMRACSDTRYKRIIAVMGSQMGKTAGLLNVIGQRLDDDPAPIIYVGPTRSNIDHVIEPKVMELLKQTPSLWHKVSKGKKLSKTHKRVSGVSLRLAWAGSPTELASDSAVLVLVDEIDRMNDNIKGEGQVFELAEARTSTYADGKAIGTSTPTLGNVETFIHPLTKLEHWAVSDTLASPIWRLWQEGTRHEWAVPCPSCTEYFIPRFKHLTWQTPSKENNQMQNAVDLARQTAALACPHCGCLIDESQKHHMNQRGHFIAPGEYIDKEGILKGTADTLTTDMATFWVSGLCSFSPKKTFGFLAKKWVAAQLSSESERMQSVMNTDFGELYQVGGEAPAWTIVADRRLDYKQGEVPEKANLLTAGVDVQQNRLVYVIRGWGLEFESWLIEQGELWGETDKPAVWLRLSSLLQNSWQDKTLQEKSISTTAIDTGYQTQMVYQFCRQHPGITLATKGHDTLDKPFHKTAVDVNSKGEVLTRSLSLWHFNTDQAKSWVHARIEWPAEQPGGWWLPIDVSDDYCKQIVAEQRCVKPNGKITWVKVKKDNHYLDAEALAYLAIRILSAGRQYILTGEPIQQHQGWRILHPGYGTETGIWPGNVWDDDD